MTRIIYLSKKKSWLRFSSPRGAWSIDGEFFEPGGGPVLFNGGKVEEVFPVLFALGQVVEATREESLVDVHGLRYAEIDVGQFGRGPLPVGQHLLHGAKLVGDFPFKVVFEFFKVGVVAEAAPLDPQVDQESLRCLGPPQLFLPIWVQLPVVLASYELHYGQALRHFYITVSVKGQVWEVHSKVVLFREPLLPVCDVIHDVIDTQVLQHQPLGFH